MGRIACPSLFYNHNFSDMSWEDWIYRQSGLSVEKTAYDILAELAVSSYNLDKKHRKAELKDRCQCFIIWWNKNKHLMNKYKSLHSVGELMNKNHATIIHQLKRRKPTIMYDINTRCINDFLNS
jgi:hypothetical protein